MDNQDKHLEDFFNRSLESFGDEPSAAVWAGVERRLERPKRFYHHKIFWLMNSIWLAIVMGISWWGVEQRQMNTVLQENTQQYLLQKENLQQQLLESKEQELILWRELSEKCERVLDTAERTSFYQWQLPDFKRNFYDSSASFFYANHQTTNVFSNQTPLIFSTTNSSKNLNRTQNSSYEINPLQTKNLSLLPTILDESVLDSLPNPNIKQKRKLSKPKWRVGVDAAYTINDGRSIFSDQRGYNDISSFSPNFGLSVEAMFSPYLAARTGIRIHQLEISNLIQSDEDRLDIMELPEVMDIIDRVQFVSYDLKSIALPLSLRAYPGVRRKFRRAKRLLPYAELGIDLRYHYREDYVYLLGGVEEAATVRGVSQSISQFKFSGWSQGIGFSWSIAPAFAWDFGLYHTVHFSRAGSLEAEYREIGIRTAFQFGKMKRKY